RRSIDETLVDEKRFKGLHSQRDVGWNRLVIVIVIMVVGILCCMHPRFGRESCCARGCTLYKPTSSDARVFGFSHSAVIHRPAVRVMEILSLPACGSGDLGSFSHALAVTPDENFKLHPRLASPEDAQLFGRGGRHIDNGALSTIFAVWSTIHDNNIDGSHVAKVCDADNRTEGISAVCGHGFVLVEYSPASCLAALKVGSIEGCVPDLCLEYRPIGWGLFRGSG